MAYETGATAKKRANVVPFIILAVVVVLLGGVCVWINAQMQEGRRMYNEELRSFDQKSQRTMDRNIPMN